MCLVSASARIQFGVLELPIYLYYVSNPSVGSGVTRYGMGVVPVPMPVSVPAA